MPGDVASASGLTDESAGGLGYEGEGLLTERHWAGAMAAAQAGDEAAYRRLLQALLPNVRRQVRFRVSEHADAEDIVQNALIAIHRGRHTYRPERPFGPWMRTIVRHCVVDWFRQRGRRLAREVPVASPETHAETGPAIVVPDILGDRLDPALVQALSGLPAKQREAVEMIQLEGLSVAEAALRVGVTPGALKVRAHRGYRALRAALDRDSFRETSWSDAKGKQE